MKKLFHISRNLDIKKSTKLGIRGISIVFSFVICALIASCFTDNGFALFFEESFNAMAGSTRKFVNLLEEMALLLGISLALLPAFKMKFWNIGGEGQVLIGGLCAAIFAKFVGPFIPNALTIVLMILVAAIGGSIWAVIPAIFKAVFDTNETLFTLMMNYVAMGLCSFVLRTVDPQHGQISGVPYGKLPQLFGMNYLFNVFFILGILLILFFYLRYTKHGYELTIVGESLNTARYLGINTKKVIIRTIAISGLICGIVGALIFGFSSSVGVTHANGRGFTAVLITWLGDFNPFEMLVMSFLVAFVNKGANQMAAHQTLDQSSFSNTLVAIFFFTLIAANFFINYKIKFNKSNQKETPALEGGKK